MHRLGLLGRFATGVGYGEGHGLGRWLIPARAIADVPDHKVSRIAFPELSSLLQRKLRPGSEQAILRRRNERFQQRIPDSWLAEADGVIGFDTSSWWLAKRCQAMGKPFYLDMSIPHSLTKEAIYQQLRIEFPAWAEQLPGKPEWMLAQEAEEMALADTLVVATSFTRQSLVENGVDEGKIVLNPYGTDLQYFSNKWEEAHRDPDSAAIRFVFMGKIGARKGIPWLLRVWPALHAAHPGATLTLAGDGGIPAGVALPRGVSVHPFVPAADRAAFLKQHDVFVFPSYFEGFGQVILEAMACGLPVISTSHTAAPEIMSTDAGFIVSPGDDKALLSAMQHFAVNPETIKTMGIAARRDALPFSWEAYGERWEESLKFKV